MTPLGYLVFIVVSLWIILCCHQQTNKSFFSPSAHGGEGCPKADDKNCVRTILYEETFEGSHPFATAYNVEVGADHSLNIVDAPVHTGKRAARFELRIIDPIVKTGKRAEVTIIKGHQLPDIEMWYSFAVYFPSEGFAYDHKQEAINQWYQQGTPATALRVEDDRLMVHTGNSPEARKKLDLGPVVKDTWYEFVFHFIHSSGDDGLIEVWQNGTKVLTHRGGNMYNIGIMPKWKVGIYKSSFKYKDSSVERRILYFDNIKVGNQHAVLDDMIPSSSVN